jgi:hypothetical protein
MDDLLIIRPAFAVDEDTRGGEGRGRVRVTRQLIGS